MIEHIARQPRVRDRSIFVGDPEDIVPDAFGPGLPAIREWTEQHFDFAGYVTGFDPAGWRPATRASELGYADDERVCVVTVGGSGVGAPSAAPGDRRLPGWRSELVPDLRMVVVAGPRIDPATAAAGTRASRSAATCTTCTGTSRPATSPSSRAG